MAIEQNDGGADGPWPLPEGWTWAALGDLGTWMGGGTPSKANVAFWTNGTVPWVSPKDMKVEVIGETEDMVTAAAIEGSSAKYVPEGSVLMVMRSGILKHSFPVAITDRIVTLNQDLRALTPHSGIDPRYVARYLALAATRVLNDCSKDGATVDSIEVAALERLRVPLAAITEQRNIVARVDALFAEVAEGEAALATAREGLDTFRRALLKAAVTGELTKDWRAANPVSENGRDLLASVARDRAGKAVPKGRANRADISPLDNSSLPELPEGWAWATLGGIAETVRNGTSAAPRATSNQHEILRISAVRPLWIDEAQIRLVCNAAVNPYYGPLLDIKDEAFDKIMGSNVKSNIWLCALAIPQMAERGNGSVVIISSIGGLRGSTVIGAYGISKAADFSLCRSLAGEWGPKGVRVNCVAPGLVKTDFAKALWEDEERLKRRCATTPLRRIGEPDEIAGAVAYLGSDASSFMTGQTIVVDGGVTTASV